MDKMTFLPSRFTLTVGHYNRDYCFVVKFRDSEESSNKNKRKCIVEMYYLYEMTDIFEAAKINSQLLLSRTCDIDSDDTRIQYEVKDCIESVIKTVEDKYGITFSISVKNISVKTFCTQIQSHILASV